MTLIRWLDLRASALGSLSLTESCSDTLIGSQVVSVLHSQGHPDGDFDTLTRAESGGLHLRGPCFPAELGKMAGSATTAQGN